MKIIVLVKQVPNTTEVKLDPKTGNLIREGIESIINPDDRHALEAAVRIREAQGGKVTVLSMGPPQAIDAVSEAMGMGDRIGTLAEGYEADIIALDGDPRTDPTAVRRVVFVMRGGVVYKWAGQRSK